MSYRSATTGWRRSLAPPLALMSSLSRALLDLYLSYLDYRFRRSLRTVLHSLPDRTLKDIGVDRNDIDAIVSVSVQAPDRKVHTRKEVPPENFMLRLASRE